MDTHSIDGVRLVDMPDQQSIRLSREVERLVTAPYAPSFQVNSATPREHLRSMRYLLIPGTFRTYIA